MRRPGVRFFIALMIAIILAALAGLQPARAATGPLCYVDMDATGGTNDGNSWANAYVSLQSALTDTNCTEIWVAEGLYKPGVNQTDTFQVHSGVAVYGGFAGTETARTQRNWDTYITVLSGDVENNDITDANGVVLTYTDIVGTNSNHVTYMDGNPCCIGASTILDGFTVTAGKANGGGYDGHGGGLFCDGAYSENLCNPTLTNMVFVGNKSTYGNGGAIFNSGSHTGMSSPSITDSVFSYNFAGQYGGAIYNEGIDSGQSNPTLERVTFDHNTGTYGGGAIFNDGQTGTSNPSLTDVEFELNNVPSGAGGAMYNRGDAGLSSPSLLRVTFHSNSSNYSGGAMHSSGSNGTSSPSLTDVSFSQNSASDGGAMYNYGDNGVSSPNLARVTFEQNHAMGNGGAMVNDGESSGSSSPTLTNVTFSGNEAQASGGAIYDFSSSGGYASPIPWNVTFHGNSAGVSGGAVFGNGTGSGLPSVVNVILWGDTAVTSDPEMGGSSNPYMTYSIAQGGCASIPGATCGSGNLSTDPKLAALGDNGGATQTMALVWGSPAIDAGNDSVCTSAPVSGLDQRGIHRPQGTHCDIGALERIPPGTRIDFESDGISDIGYWRSSTGAWAILQSSQGFSYSGPRYYSWGSSTDILAVGDYDGDGLWDPSVRTPPAGGQSAAYRILLSTTGYNFGSSLTIPAGWPGLGDTPVPGDYNGDGIMEPGIWRGNTGVWIIPLSPTFTTHAFYSWGASGDKPIAADLDGDGQTDIGYWRPSTGVWGFLLSGQGYSYATPQFISWGTSTDTPVMADYDGDGLADPAVVIPPSGGQSKAYRILLSTLAYDPAQSMTVPAGWPGLNDTPLPADYDGDGKADAGIWRANTGIWIIPMSHTNNTSYIFAAWGAAGDVPAR